MSQEPSGHSSETADTRFAHWMAQIDAWQALRMRDPHAALQQVSKGCGRWADLSAAQDALLRARCGLQTGAALIMLGRQDEAQSTLDALVGLLQSPLLDSAQADAQLQREARRCAISCSNARATLAHGKGDFAGALRAYQHALDLARALGEGRFEAHVLVNLANAYEESGLPAEALDHSRQALTMAQALGMDELVADIHHNIGNALAACGQREQGLQSNRRAFEAYTALGLAQKQGYALVAIAERLLELQRYDEAEAALHEHGTHQGLFTNPQYAAYAHYLRGRVASARGHAKAARQAFEQALAVTDGQLGDVVGQARSLLELGQLALHEQQADTAQRHAHKALALLQDSHALRDQMRACGLLSQVAKARGDFEQALAHHEAYHAGYVRCFNEEAARKAALLAVRHEVDLARADAQRQRLENARLTEALAQIGARLQSRPQGSVAGPAASPARAEDLQGLGLTPREAEVLYWVTQGKTNEDVTLILNIGISAVKKHLANIFDKLGVENRTAAANAVLRRQVTG